MKKDQKKELNVYYFNTGSCNGCDIELLAGVLLNESEVLVKTIDNPKKADLLVFTGILTKKIFPFFKKVLRDTPRKAKKIAFGSCAISGNVFSGADTFTGPIDRHTKIDLYINGCPPKGDEYLKEALRRLGVLSNKKIKNQDIEYYRGELKFFPEKCIGCLTCVYYCPAQTIKLNSRKELSPKKGKSNTRWELSYEYEKCFFCSMCQRKCPTKAIVLTHDALMVEKDKKKFITKGRIKKK